MTQIKHQQITNYKEKLQSSLIAQTRIALPALIIAFFIALVIFVVFSPSLKCGFVWDDEIFIKQNPLVISNTIEVKKIFTSVVNENDYYPATIISLAFNYQYGKLNPAGYHLCNVILHMLNTMLVFMFIFIITKRNLLMASIVALFFGIHPLHVESVAWVTERKDVLFMFFFLIGLITYLRFRESGKWIWFFITIILFLLSCLSKSTAVVFPAILLLIDYLLNEKLNKKMLFEKIPLLLISIGFVILTFVLHNKGSLQTNVVQKTFIHQIMFASYDLIWYAYKLIIPNNLSAYYLFPDEKAIPLIYKISPVILLCVLIIIFVFLRKNKAIVFGLAFYFFSIVLMLQLIPTGNGDFNMADRYSYLASIGLLFLIAYSVNFIWQKTYKFRYAIVGIVTIYAIILSHRAYSRTKVWQNDETLWSDVIIKNPERCFVGYYNRGFYYQYTSKDLAKAFSDYSKAIEINPNYVDAYNNRGELLMNEKKYDLALSDIDKSIQLNPNYAKAFTPSIEKAKVYYNRGLLYEYGFKQYDLALADYNTALKLNPKNSGLYNYRGILSVKMGRNDLAIVDFSKAIELDASMPDYWINRSVIENNIGKKQEAIADAIKAQQLGMQVDTGYLKELRIR